MFRLTVKDPEGTRKVVTERTQILVGRRVGVDVCLQDISVSRNHCLLRIEGDRVLLTDLSSAGGTLVKGKKIGEILLEAGAVFEIGKSRVCLEAFRTSSTGLVLEPPEGAHLCTATVTQDPPGQVQLPVGDDTPAPADDAKQPTHAAASEFGRELRVILSKAPWYTISVFVHAIIFLLLHLFTTFSQEGLPRDAAILAQAPSDGGEIDPDTVAEEPEMEEPELEEEVLEEIDEDQPEERESDEDTYIPPPPVRAEVDGLGGGTELLRLVLRKRVAKIDDREQVRTNPGDFHRRAREIMEGEGGTPRGVRRGALVVTKGDHDSVERVLDEYHLPYKLVTLEDIADGTRKLLPGQILFVNCHMAAPRLRKKLAQKVRAFVKAGGWMVTTDWAINPFVTQGFPGRVKVVPGKPPQWGDTTIAVAPTKEDLTLLRGVFHGARRARWWLESSSTFFKPVPGQGVRALIVSDDLQRRYKAYDVVCEFTAGKGRVVHVLGHLYQEDGNLQGMIAMHRMLFNLIRERYPDAEDSDRDH
ncbi:MAG: FHA domain-containing protein [Planctomycetota bacterium]